MTTVNQRHYWRYLGLSADPFPTEGPPAFYISHQVREYLEFLLNMNRYRHSLLLLMSEPGMGKSMLINNFLQALPRTVHQYSLDATPTLSGESLLLKLIEAFHLKRFSAFDLYAQAEQLLTQLQATGQTYLLVIDNAEKLPVNIQQLCLYLVKHQIATQPSLQIILVGDLNLSNKFLRLAEQQEDPLNQYVVQRLQLEPFDKETTEKFIRHRLQEAGDDGRVTLFGQADITAVFQRSLGVPAAVNYYAREFLCELATEWQPQPLPTKEQKAEIDFSWFSLRTMITQIKHFRWWLSVLVILAILLFGLLPLLQKRLLREEFPQPQLPSSMPAANSAPALLPLAASATTRPAVSSNLVAPPPGASTNTNTNSDMVRLVENGEVKWVSAQELKQEMNPEHVDLSKNQSAPSESLPPSAATPATTPDQTMPAVTQTSITAVPAKIKSTKKNTAIVSEKSLLTNAEKRLLKLDPHYYTLQLFISSTAQGAQAFVSKQQLNDVASVYRLRFQKHTRYVVVLGYFSSRAQALNEAKKWEPKLNIKPWVQSYEKIHSDIQAFENQK